ncbi:MAG: hypothetical protein KDD70_10380 [Bdellovibrionales bacterium]|nr:hypothetical protein [Bdellovibrionales bacterium]
MSASRTFSEAIEISQKRLSRTVAHVLRHWIPVDRVLLGKIREGLHRGVYENDKGSLFKDLKSDLSLYTWCLRELCKSLQAAGPLDRDFDPIRALEELGCEDFKELLNKSESEFSNHELEQSNPEQVRILREVMLGASTVDIANKHFKGDPRAYGVSLLRQLGITLIAWNYPSVFEECVEKVKKSGDLDVLIAKRLGFSPGLLAMKLVREWGISEKKCVSLGLMVPEDIEDILGENTSASHGQFFRDICEIGEKLARANDPKTYPTQAKNWGTVERKVQQALGEQGLVKIREHFEDNCAHYAVLLPQLVENDGKLFDRLKYPDSKRERNLLLRNRFLEGCSKDVKVSLKAFYSKLDKAQEVNRELVRSFIHETIPNCGFHGGCVFTFDPTISKLVPQLQFGIVHALEPEAVDYSTSLADANMVQKAFQRIEPIHRKVRVPGSVVESDSVFAVAGILGKHRKLGVLYLELPSCLHYGDDAQIVMHFRAIGRALSDCLRV